MKNIKKHGFTLAEVLITLAIIGVVAALTIPTIISNYNKKVTLTRLQKTYTVLKNAFELAKAEHGDYSTWSWNQIPETGSKRTEYFWETYIFPYLRVSKTCFPKTDDCMAEIKHSNSMKMDYIPNTGAFVLNDGTSVLTWANSGTYYPHVWAYVDVNGNAEPNMVGKDVFAMYFSPGNPGKALGTKNEAGEFVDSGKTFNIGYGLIFFGEGSGSTPEDMMQQDFTIQDASTSAENFSCSEKGLGATCGAVISMSGWKIPEDYPFEF